MKKKIGVRISIMLVVMALLYGATAICFGYASEQALGGMNRIRTSWTQLERLHLQVVKQVDNSNFYANMIVWMRVPESQTMLSQGFPAMVETTNGLLAQMTELCESLEPKDLVGVSKDELLAAMNTYADSVHVIQEQGSTVAKLYLAGDAEASAAANNGATKNIQAMSAAETALFDLVKQASDNLAQQRITVSDTFSGIAGALFFVFLGAALLMLFSVRRSIAKPASNASKQKTA